MEHELPAPDAGALDLVAGAERLPAVWVPVTSLEPGPYLRQTGTDAEHVRALVDVADLASLPPILVQRHGMRVIDGMHRLEAAKICRAECIRARLVDCSDDEALVLAIKSNTLHGLPLSRPDRISGAKQLLTAHPDWSDRAIAEVAGLSGRSVAALRSHSADAQQFSRRLGRDGKRRPVANGEGRKRAAEYLSRHSDASLRQVAREAGVSLGTVHDVRERLRRGADPTAVRRPPPPERASGDTPSSAASAGPRPPLRPAQPTWPGISAKLARDPTLRYNEGGRAFLRWMTSRAMESAEWTGFVESVPDHWLKDMSQIADVLSTEWAMFAERLRRRQDNTSLWTA
jgi:ParB-like chromosome segregation protein Spo0J